MVVDTFDEEGLAEWGPPCQAARVRGWCGLRGKSCVMRRRARSESRFRKWRPSQKGQVLTTTTGHLASRTKLLHTRPEVETDGPGPNLGTQDQEVWW